MSKYTATVRLAQHPNSNHLGEADIELSEELAITGIILQESRAGTINLKMPTVSLGGKDAVFPITKKSRQEMTEATAAAYEQALVVQRASSSYESAHPTPIPDKDTGMDSESSAIEAAKQYLNSDTALWDEYKAVAEKLGGVVMLCIPKALGTKSVKAPEIIKSSPPEINRLIAKLLGVGYTAAIRDSGGRIIPYDKCKKSLRETLTENSKAAKKANCDVDNSSTSGSAISAKQTQLIRKKGDT